MITRTGLSINVQETVQSITPVDQDCFEVQTTKGTYTSRRVVIAIGRRGVPRKLGIPGEDAGHVAYALRDPEHFTNNTITVVGGGDSAVEAALALADQPGNAVALSYRKDKFARCKPANLDRIQAAFDRGLVEPLLSTHLTEISETHITYKDAAGAIQTRANEFVFVFIGGELPTPFLKACGIAIDTKFGTP